MSDQPRLSDQFKNEVESPHHLNHVKTQEKQVLPTESDIVEEKKHLEFQKSIEEFDPENLSHVKVTEKVQLPSQQDIVQEKVIQEAADFDHKRLSHVDPVIKHDVEVIEK